MWREDDYIKPMLEEALNIDKSRVKIFASPWSMNTIGYYFLKKYFKNVPYMFLGPPAWMKTNKQLFGAQGGILRSDCYGVYADYFVKYIQECKRLGRPIYAITCQNEPLYAPNSYPGMIMSSQEQSKFIRDFLGPKFTQAGITTKIIAYDHNFDAEGIQYAKNVLSDLAAQKYVAGTGFHTYTGAPHSGISDLHNAFPSKDIWMTEAGFGTWIGETLK